MVMSPFAGGEPVITKSIHHDNFISEFETNLRRERQLEGIKNAKEKGVYKGRKQNIDVEQIKKLKEEGYGATQIARELNIHRDSVYRLLKKGGEK